MSRTIKLGAFYRSLPMLVAEEKGFYADRDIEIDYGQVKSSTQQFDFLSDGRYEVVQTSPDNTANYRLNDDNPIGKRVDAQGFMGLDYGMKLIVVARSGIETIEDLRRAPAVMSDAVRLPSERGSINASTAPPRAR